MKKLFFFLIASFQFLNAQPLKSDSLITDSVNAIQELYFNADSMLIHASQYLNLPYKFGGESPKTGFDCSGFVCYNFRRYNVDLPHSSYEQIKRGEKINKTEAKAGDLIFFKTDNSISINHVGIVIEVNGDEIQFIHSSTSKGVIISSTKQLYYKNALVQINRIL